MSRAEKRRAQREAVKGRSHPGWTRHASPKQLKMGTGWFAELDRVFRDNDNQFVVMIRDVETEWGTVQHACMRNAEGIDMSWGDKQRIKNELFGEEATAVEVFPKESELVDEANMYHLWVLPPGMNLPFGLR